LYRERKILLIVPPKIIRVLSCFQDNVGSAVSQQQPSPQSSPEVNVTCNIQPDLIEDHISTQIVTSDNGGLEEEEEADIPEPDEADVSNYSSFSLVMLPLLKKWLFRFL
jgi:hypothetical protein